MERFVNVVVISAVLLTAFVQKSYARPSTEYAAVDTSLTGTWITRGPEGITSLFIAPDGMYGLDLEGDGSPEVQGVIVSTGRQLEISDTGGPLACPNTGTYTFRVDEDGTLRITSVDDTCVGRRMTVALVEWANRDQVDRIERAITDFNMAIELTPEDGLRYFQRAWTKYYLGDKEGTCSDLRTAIQLGLQVQNKYDENCQ